MSVQKSQIALSLISHTNIGKTTLARTLLRKDIGLVADRAHVTLENQKYTVLETEAGESLAALGYARLSQLSKDPLSVAGGQESDRTDCD